MKIGLGLAGGGARGAYQVGVWKALKEHDIDQYIDAVSGASVGSINALLFSMGEYDKAEELWMTLEKDTLFHLDKDTFKRLFKEKWSFFTKGIYNTSIFERMMDDAIDMDKIANKRVYIATTSIGGSKKKFFRVLKANYKYHFKKTKDNLKFHTIEHLNKQQIKKLVLASCAIPVVFKPITIGEETYYDGGILSNMPIMPLQDCDCDRIIIIDLFRHNFHRRTEKNDKRIKIIYPKKNLGGILDFKPNKIKRRFELGYKDGLEFIENNKDFLRVN